MEPINRILEENFEWDLDNEIFTDEVINIKQEIVAATKIFVGRKAQELKNVHEAPNDNGSEYNAGYVQGMNDILNFLRK